MRFVNYAQIDKSAAEARANLAKQLVPRMVEPYIKHIPHAAQIVFLNLPYEEVMYGGAAGGGKSDALLMAALQYVDVPGYSALLLRRTWPDLNSPGAILDRARTWLADTDAHPRDGGRIWEFPGGGRIQFGYLQHDKDKYKYQSAEYQFIGFDELTQFEDTMYTYLFSRLRRPQLPCLNCQMPVRRYNTGYKHTTQAGRKKCGVAYPDPKVLLQYGPGQDGVTLFDVPLRMRSATNPGGVGHTWVRERFIDARTKKDDAIFVPARLNDNPAVDQESYMKSLSHLLPIDRERLLNGDWDVSLEGLMFSRHWFNNESDVPVAGKRCRYWDLAATAGGGDYTVGALLCFDIDGRWHIEDIKRGQWSPNETEKVIYATAMDDRTAYGGRVAIRMEQEPGSSGVNVIDYYKRRVLYGHDFKGVRPTGPKEVRAKPLASAAEAGNVSIKTAQWNRDFLDEVSLFPEGNHDDQVDAVTGAFAELAFAKKVSILV